MKIYSETSLRSFNFWSGGEDTAKELTFDELDQIEAELESAYPEGIDETELNDLFWHEDDTIAEWLGYSSWEEFTHRNDVFTCPVCGCEWDNEEDAEECCKNEEDTEEEEE